VRQPSIEKIDNELIAGNALIVQTLKHKRDGGHAYLIIGRTKHYLTCVNLFREETVNRVTPLQLGKNPIFYPPKAA